MRVLIVSGGTGGHIFPALSVAEEIEARQPDARFLFVGSMNRGLKGVPLSRAARFVPLPVVGVPRTVSSELASVSFRFMASFDRCLRRIASFGPQVAVGFGNFGSIAPLLAAKFRHVPVAIHEANAIPGRANLFLSRFSDRVMVSFPRTVGLFPNGSAEVVGMPVRKEFTKARNRLGALANLKLSGTEFTLLVAGGSQGARTLNREVCRLLPLLQRLPQRIQLIHLTGKEDYSWVKACYERSSPPGDRGGRRWYVAAFEPRMKMLYDAADLILARAGASTVAEIIETGTPAILVPFPHATAHHQDENAGYLEKNNGAVVLKQRSSPPGRPIIPGLVETLRELIGDRERLREMAQNNRRLADGCAAGKIVDVLFEIARGEEVAVPRMGQRVTVRA